MKNQDIQTCKGKENKKPTKNKSVPERNAGKYNGLEIDIIDVDDQLYMKYNFVRKQS